MPPYNQPLNICLNKMKKENTQVKAKETKEEKTRNKQ